MPSFESLHDETALRASILVQIKKLPRAVRLQLASRDWLERERSEKALAQAVVDGLKGFTVTRDPANIPPARSQS